MKKAKGKQHFANHFLNPERRDACLQRSYTVWSRIRERPRYEFTAISRSARLATGRRAVFLHARNERVGRESALAR